MKLGTYNYSTGEAFDLAGVLLGTFPNRLEAWRAMYAARLPVEVWFAETIPPIPLLQQLNDWVIQQNEKRLPKWKFRFAPDLAIQIQSKLTRKHAVLFEGIAIRTENLSAKHFTEPKTLEGLAFWKLASGPEDRKVLHVHVSQLNHLLAPHGIMVRSQGGGYRIRRAASWRRTEPC